MSCAMSVYLGVYALGAAEPAERALVEAHLAGCLACQAELARLEPLPGLLAQVPLSLLGAGSPASAPAQPPGQAAAARPAVSGGQPARARRSAAAPARAGKGGIRRGRGLPWRVVAATASVAAAAGAAGGFWLAQPGPSPAPAAITLTGANPAAHVYVTITLTATSWGTSIRLVARGLPLNVPCRLIARSRTGGTEVTGVWNAWSAGPVTVPASAGLRPADIASLRVATTSRSLVTVTIRRPAAAVPATSHPDPVRPAHVVPARLRGRG
jgi:anti-sigma-K factor RskA